MKYAELMLITALWCCQSPSEMIPMVDVGDAGATSDVTPRMMDGHIQPAMCEPATGTTCTPGAYFPAFSLVDCNGAPWNLQELLRLHDRALLYFMASWFNPINSDPVATLRDWHTDFGDTIRFVVVLREEEGGSEPSSIELCQAWSRSNNANFLVLIDPADQVTSKCLDQGIPTAVAIDCDGSVYYQSELLPAATAGAPPI